MVESETIMTERCVVIVDKTGRISSPDCSPSMRKLGIWPLIGDSAFEYCPYCGKKLKIERV